MATVEAADSWLSVDGRVRSFDAHVARFRRAVEFADGDGEAAVAAMIDARAATPDDGKFFPRVDFSGGEFSIRVRPDPDLQESTTLWSAPGDPRTSPAVKGPDIEALIELNALAAQHGADEAVLLSSEGEVIEASFSALCWWRDDVLCYPDEDLERIDSVTWKCVRALAVAQGIRLQPEFCSPADLAGTEVWALNARHGIRHVRAWQDGPEVAPPTRVQLWRARLDELRREVGS